MRHNDAMTLEEAKALAAEVNEGKSRSYVQAAQALATFVSLLPDVSEPSSCSADAQSETLETMRVDRDRWVRTAGEYKAMALRRSTEVLPADAIAPGAEVISTSEHPCNWQRGRLGVVKSIRDGSAFVLLDGVGVWFALGHLRAVRGGESPSFFTEVLAAADREMAKLTLGASQVPTARNACPAPSQCKEPTTFRLVGNGVEARFCLTCDVRFETRAVPISSPEREGYKRGTCPPNAQCLACDRLGYHLEPVSVVTEVVSTRSHPADDYVERHRGIADCGNIACPGGTECWGR